MSKTMWQRLSVQEFFGSFTWEGSSRSLEQPTAGSNLGQSVKQAPWPCQTVQEFLGNYNWQGITRLQPIGEQSQIRPSFFSVTLPVEEFWNCFIWKGKPQIAAVPQLDANPNNNLSHNTDLNLSDLSDLF